MNPMRILIVGFGSIGQRHFRIIREALPSVAVAVVSAHANANEVAGAEVFRDQSAALAWKPTLTFVTNPPTEHVKTALAFARAGSHLFVEKPLSVSTAGIDGLIAECSKRGLVLAVGYVLRFFEPVTVLKRAIAEGRIGRVLSVSASVGQYLPEWRLGRDYRRSVSARRDLGGGVVSELSHELDYVRWLAGDVSTVAAWTGRLSDLEIDVEDTAEILLGFTSGAVARIHLDMVDRAAHRDCRIVGTEGTLFYSSEQGHRVGLLAAGTNDWVDLRPAGPIERDAMYRAQLEHLLSCIAKNSAPLVGAVDGRLVVELILAVKHAAESGTTIQV